jgi:H+/gluconate symporter-like permease
MNTISGIGILLGFAILTIGAWKKINLIPITLVVSAVIAVTGGLNILETWSGPYIDGFVGFAGPYLLLFVLGSLFGKILEDSGASWRIANEITNKVGDKWSLVAYVAIATGLVYGGVSIFVVIFVLLPISKNLFIRLNIPWSIFPGLALGAAVAGVGIIPGSLQILNIIPTKFLGTELTAGLGIGLFGTVFYFGMLFFYFKWVLKKKDEMFDIDEFKNATTKEVSEGDMNDKAPNIILSLIPILSALLLINLFKLDIIIGFLLACIIGFVLFYKSLGKPIETINEGFSNGIMPLITVAVVVGIAKTVSAVPFFTVLKDSLINLPFSGLTKAVIVTNTVAFMTGSASGSMTMILDLFSADFIAWGNDPEILHRVLTTASQGLDTMPWCSVVVVFLSLSGISYSRGYKHIFVTSVAGPILTAIFMILISPLFI